jgi:ketosteroid isomerase-like protein
MSHQAENVTDLLNEKIATYLRSVERADTGLAATVWATGPEVSFIHPRGHERGWEQVAQNFYQETMGAMFTQRTLRLVGPSAMHVYGEAAVVEFDWDFVATRRDNGESLHTTGRESQVYARHPDQGWRLVHVHYSGPPVTGAGQGF